MPRSLSYIFPIGATTDVCQAQSSIGPTSLALNGNLVNPLTGVMSFIDYGYSRDVSLTSPNENAGVTFTITGTQNGVLITEELPGPDNSTTYSTQIYDTITSITTDGPVDVISVGTGTSGFFPLIQVNTYAKVINYTLSLARSPIVQVHERINLVGITENVINNGYTYLEMTEDLDGIALSLNIQTPFIYSNSPYSNATDQDKLNPTCLQLLVTVSNMEGNQPIRLDFLQI